MVANYYSHRNYVAMVTMMTNVYFFRKTVTMETSQYINRFHVMHLKYLLFPIADRPTFRLKYFLFAQLYFALVLSRNDLCTWLLD